MGRITDLLADHRTIEDLRDRSDRSPAVHAIDDEAAAPVFDALSSGTARQILAALYDQPRTASELAAVTDTSVQNVAYHLDKLQSGDVVEVADTWYSDQGTEMKVYAPTNAALVLFGGEAVDRSTLREAIKRFVAFVGVVTVTSAVVDRLVRQPAIGFASVKTNNTTVDPTTANPPGEVLAAWVTPGVLFFAGALFAFLVVTIWWSVHRPSPMRD